MAFPWKKTRISRLVSDHIQKQKRGGSLVVETGFPTSLVDLFVKNRDRLKKPSKKKRSTSPDPDTNPSLSPLNNSKPSSTDSNSELAESRRCSTANQIDTETVAGDSGPPNVRQNVAVCTDTAVEEIVKNTYFNRFVAAALKLFAVVVLALGTKRFAVWITLSAFLLFFLEYLGNRIFRIYKPSSDSHNMLELLKKNLLPSVRITNFTLGSDTNCAKGEKSIVSVSPVLIENSELDESTAEISMLQQPESNSLPTVENTRSSKEKFTPVLSLKEVMEREDNMSSEPSEAIETFEVKHQNRRKWKIAKVGSKMKKLVPKNLRSSKKKRSDSKSMIDNSIEEEQEQEQQKDAEPCELELEDQSLMLPAEKSDPEDEIVDTVCTSSGLERKDSKANISDICSCGDSKAIEVGEEVKRKTGGNLRYWFICLIVLAGLVGGRILALGLTLSWCLVLKSGGIPRRYIRVPLFRTSVKFST